MSNTARGLTAILVVLTILAIIYFLYRRFFKNSGDENGSDKKSTTGDDPAQSGASPLSPNPIVDSNQLKVGDILIATRTRQAYSAPPHTPGVTRYTGVFEKGDYIGVVTAANRGGALKVKNWTSGPYGYTSANGWNRVTDFYLVPGEYEVKKTAA